MTLSNPAQYISGRTVQEQMNSLIDYVDQRAADVALDAIASDVAQVHQDMLDADADASAAAASAAAAAGTLANAVKKTGEASQSIQGDVAIVGALSAGATTLNGATAINANLSVVGDLSVSNDATLSGSTSVITQATGTYSSQAASGLKVKNELDNYAPMVRTTGTQVISGVKKHTAFVWNGLAAIADDYSAGNTVNKACTFPMSTGDRIRVQISSGYNNGTYQYADLEITCAPTPKVIALMTAADTSAAASASGNYGVLDNGDGTFSLYVNKVQRYQIMYIQTIAYSRYGVSATPPDITVNKEVVSAFPAGIVMAVKAAYKDVA